MSLVAAVGDATAQYEDAMHEALQLCFDVCNDNEISGKSNSQDCEIE